MSPQESKVQAWFRLAEVEDNRADLFAHLSRSDNWFDLYKSAELARRMVGGQAKLKQILGADFAEWERIWRTANCHRHSPGQHPLPPKPAKFEEARKFILKVIPRLI